MDSDVARKYTSVDSSFTKPPRNERASMTDMEKFENWSAFVETRAADCYRAIHYLYEAFRRLFFHMYILTKR